jgi:hypothetical protein
VKASEINEQFSQEGLNAESPALAAPKYPALAELAALLAQRLSTGAIFAMLGLDAFTVRAVIVVVINLPMCGRILRRTCVICRYFRHLCKIPPPDNDDLTSFVSFAKTKMNTFN